MIPKGNECTHFCQFGSVDSLFWTKSKRNIAKFLSKSRVCNSSIKNLITVLWLYAHALSIFLLCCKFQILILKAVEVTETQTLLCHVYKAKFLLNKSRVCNSTNNNSIRVLWPLCICLLCIFMHMLIMVQVSNHYLENYRRICGDTNPTMPCV